MLEFAGIFDGVHKIVIQLNATIYKFVGWLYQIYVVIASARILKSDVIENLTKRMMVIVGVVALFIIAFSLIKTLLDPEKEIKNTSKIFVNIVTSIVMLTLVNTVFNYLYEGQSLLLKQNVIGKIIIGGYNYDDSDISISNAGNIIAADTLGAFFTQNEDLIFLEGDAKDGEETVVCKNAGGDDVKIKDLRKSLNEEDGYECYYEVSETQWWKTFLKAAPKGAIKGALAFSYFGPYVASYGAAITAILEGAHEVERESRKNKLLTYNDIKVLAIEDTSYFLYLAPGISSGIIDFSWLLAIICGVYLIYIFVSFCLDMAVRCAKLAALQIISPIAILSRIIPGQESIFNNWLKKTLTSFLEVFIKLAIIFFGVFLIIQVHNVNLSDIVDVQDASFGVKQIGMVAIILGILMFVKQAPGFISQIFGIDSGNMKLGIKDKLGAMVGAGAVGAVAGGVTGYMGGAIASKRNGGSFFSGGLAGAVGGFKAKGNQWKAQGTKAYQNLTGDYKGSVGYFGGKTVGTRINEKVSESNKANKKRAANKREQIENNYINQQAQKEAMRYQNVENSEAFQNIYNSRDIENEALAETKEFREEFKKRNGRRPNMEEYKAYYDQTKRRITREYFARNVRNNKYEGSAMNSEYKNYVENLNKVTDSKGNISSSRIAENFIAPKLEKDMQDVKDGNKKLSSLTSEEKEIFKNRKIDEAIGKEKANKQWAEIMKEGFKDAPGSSPFGVGGSNSSGSGGSSGSSNSNDKK